MSDFVICINNDGNPASLIVGKVYRTRPDAGAEAHSMLHVVDEDRSELYPSVHICTYRLTRSGKGGR